MSGSSPLRSTHAKRCRSRIRAEGSPAEALGQHGGVGAVVRLGVLGHDEAIPAGARQLADAACGVEAAERSLGDT